MTFSDEQLSAYLDGECDAETAAAIELALETDADLAARMEAFSNTDAVLRAAIDTTLGPVPDRLTALASGAVATLPLATRRTAPMPMRRGLLAASLVLAVAGGAAIDHIGFNPGQSPIATVNATGAPVDRALSAALSESYSGTPVELPSGKMTVALSFRTRSGSLCRSFHLTQARSGAAGVACRAPDGWRLAGWSTGAAASPGTGFTTASGPTDEVADSVIDRLGPVETFDRAGEAQAMKMGWIQP